MSSYHTRSLGHLKVNRGIVFPPLNQTLNQSNRTYFQEHNLMVHGDGLQTLPLSRGLDDNVRQKTPTSPRPLTSRLEQANSKAAEELKELQNKEKQYRNKIHNLQKAVEQLQIEVKGKDESLTQAHLKLQQIEEHFRLLYEDEKSSHEHTRQELNDTREELVEKENYVEALKQTHEQHTQELKDHYEGKLSALKSKLESEIADRDKRLGNLKKQMAGALQENSWERQQQLEELSKELSKMSEEATMLKMKLKSMAAKSREGCENCASLNSQLETKQRKILEQEANIKQLMALCKKFETQLTQQDVIMKQFAKDKGFKTNYVPKSDKM